MCFYVDYMCAFSRAILNLNWHEINSQLLLKFIHLTKFYLNASIQLLVF